MEARQLDQKEVVAPSPSKKALYAALLKAQAQIQGVEKDAYNAHSKYNYTSAEAMIGECRRVLLEAGLVAFRQDWEIEGDGQTFNVISHFVLVHPDSGTELNFAVPFPGIINGGKPKDKATAASLTSCLSYWLRDLLMIPRPDEEMDKDGDGRDKAPPAQRGSKAKKEAPKERPYEHPKTPLVYEGTMEQLQTLNAIAMSCGLDMDLEENQERLGLLSERLKQKACPMAKLEATVEAAIKKNMEKNRA